METKVIINCQRCKKTFIVTGDATSATISTNYQDRLNRSHKFSDNHPLNRHRYLKFYRRDDSQDISGVYSDPIALCEKCDQEYWENFEKAMDVLKSFFSDPAED